MYAGDFVSNPTPLFISLIKQISANRILSALHKNKWAYSFPFCLEDCTNPYEFEIEGNVNLIRRSWCEYESDLIFEYYITYCVIKKVLPTINQLPIAIQGVYLKK